jgi:uncharacterized protein YerC
VQVSTKKISNAQLRDLRQQLFCVFAELRDEESIANFWRDFFSETEQQVLVKRFAIAKLLKENISYEEIKKSLHDVASRLDRPGVQKALAVLADDEWADQLSRKILGWFSFAS